MSFIQTQYASFPLSIVSGKGQESEHGMTRAQRCGMSRSVAARD